MNTDKESEKERQKEKKQITNLEFNVKLFKNNIINETENDIDNKRNSVA